MPYDVKKSGKKMKKTIGVAMAAACVASVQMAQAQTTLDTLKVQNLHEVVVKGVRAPKNAPFAVANIKSFLPEQIHFIHSEDLLQMYPDLSPKEREDAICKKYGAVFIIGIGGKLSNGEKHDGRAPDYDDWSTVAENGKEGLNGDILIWYPVLERSFELSSMGIRVDKESLLRQLKIEGKEDREQLYFHRRLLADELPLSIGGGIGQSRLCMVLLHKAHIGEIQASIWPEEMRRECAKLGMPLI